MRKEETEALDAALAVHVYVSEPVPEKALPEP